MRSTSSKGKTDLRDGAEAETITICAGGFLAAPPGVAHSFGNDSGRPAHWLTIHAPDGGFAAFMRGVREGVKVAWDIAAVPASFGVDHLANSVRIGIGKWLEHLGVAALETLLLSDLFLVVGCRRDGMELRDPEQARQAD